MVSLRDGRVLQQGAVKEVLKHDPVVSAELKEENEVLKKVDEEVDLPPGTTAPTAAKTDGKLIVAEEVALGHVGWAPSQLYVLACCRNSFTAHSQTFPACFGRGLSCPICIGLPIFRFLA
jgi:hypothetical protein